MTDDYDVGFGRPPKHGQFPKGQSGNPAGRRTEQERFASVLREELASEIVMKIGDKKLKASVLRALTKMLINMALAGDKKAIAELMRQINRYFPEPPAADNASLPPTEEDLQILQNFLRRHAESGRKDEEDGHDNEF